MSILTLYKFLLGNLFCLNNHRLPFHFAAVGLSLAVFVLLIMITPAKNHLFRWKFNFGPQVPHSERSDLMKIEQEPLVKFRIDFETALQYRRENHMPTQFRRCAWTDLRVEVYI